MPSGNWISTANSFPEDPTLAGMRLDTSSTSEVVRTAADVKAQFTPTTIPDAVVNFMREHFGLKLPTTDDTRSGRTLPADLPFQVLNAPARFVGSEVERISKENGLTPPQAKTLGHAAEMSGAIFQSSPFDGSWPPNPVATDPGMT